MQARIFTVTRKFSETPIIFIKVYSEDKNEIQLFQKAVEDKNYIQVMNLLPFTISAFLKYTGALKSCSVIFAPQNTIEEFEDQENFIPFKLFDKIKT